MYMPVIAKLNLCPIIHNLLYIKINTRPPQLLFPNPRLHNVLKDMSDSLVYYIVVILKYFNYNPNSIHNTFFGDENQTVLYNSS